MSSDLDKFVLQYSVELKDSIRKLEELQKKMAGVSKAHKESAGQLKEFVVGASGELSKLVPQLGAVGQAARAMGAGFGVAAAAVAALAIGVKAVIGLKDKYGEQRLLGQELGVSGFRIEEYERKFVKYGVPTMDPAQAREGLKQFTALSKAAYGAPGSQEWFKMQKLGVESGSLGHPGPGLNAQLKTLATNLHGMSQPEVEALAALAGVSKDWLVSLQQIGPAIANVTEHTKEELKARQDSQRDIDKLNTDMGKFAMEMNKLQMQVGILVAGPMAKFVGYVASLVEAMNKMDPEDAKDLHDFFFGGEDAGIAGSKAIGRYLTRKAEQRKYGRKEGAKPEGSWEYDEGKDPNAQATQNALDDAAAAEDAKQVEERKREEELMAAIKNFGGSVQTFSAAVSTAQAWAAWAGAAGAASGLKPAPAPNGSGGGPGIGATRGIRNNNPGNLEYGPFAISHGATGTDGRFAIFPTMEAGVKAHEALLGGKNYAGKTLEQIIGRYAPAGENNVAAYIASITKQTGIKGGDIPTAAQIPALAAAMQVHESGYRGGGGRNPNAGQGRGDLNLARTQQSLATFLGVPLKSIQQGGVNRGDVEVAYKQVEYGIQKNIREMKAETYKPHSKEQHAKLLKDIQEQETGLGLLRQYGPSVIRDAQAGGRELTAGQIILNITIDGSKDPQVVGQAVNDHVMEMMGKAVNIMTNGQKI